MEQNKKETKLTETPYCQSLQWSVINQGNDTPETWSMSNLFKA